MGEPWERRLEVLGWGLWSLFFLEFLIKFSAIAAEPERRTLADYHDRSGAYETAGPIEALARTPPSS